MWHEFQVGQLLIAYLDRSGITVGVQFSFDDQAGARSGAGDQIDNRLAADERTSTPVPGDEAEEPMLDLIPFTGARRKMADDQLQAQLIGQFLQAYLPQPRVRPVGAARIGGDQQLDTLLGKRRQPMRLHQRRMLLTAN